MILPGRIFYKKYFLPPLGASSVLVLLCVFFYFFVNWGLVDTQGVLIESLDPKNYWKIRNMYLQTVDPILKSEKKINDKRTPFKDQIFWLRSQNYTFQGNQNEIIEFKKFLYDFNDEYTNSVAYQYGLSQEATTPMAWITYQFVHTHWIHLFMNMIFLLLVVAQLERRVKVEWIIAVFLFSGFGAGVFYLVTADEAALAMIGASGSISGLLAFTSVVLYNKGIKWSYFVSPLKGGYGVIYLPAYLIFLIFLVTDFTRVLGSKDGVEAAVAHSAHVGGALVGVFLGFFFLFDRWFKNYLIEKWGPVLGPNELQKLRD